jgi:SAM-dependent methyltransferase
VDVSTSLSPAELAPMLEQWAPWRHLIRFSNGLATDQFETGEPFNPDPLGKIRLIEERLPWDELRAGRALDVGFNCGYNTVHLAATHSMTVVGVDVSPRHKEVAEFLSDTAGVSDRVRFELADATTFGEAGTYDLVLHFGTLYHLPNPVLAIETTANNLRPGGWLALETQVYVGPDQRLSKFIHGDRGDLSNWWSLSEETLVTILRHHGLADIEQVTRVTNDWIGADEARAVYVCRRV